MNRKTLAIAMVAAMAMGTAAYAKKPPPPPPPPPAPSGPTLGSTLCKFSDITANGSAATACSGWYKGNLDGGSADMKTDSADALNAMLGVTTYTKDNLSFLQQMDVSGSTINFNAPLFGETIVAFHVGGAGGAGGVGYESTAFYEFNAGDLVGGLDTFTFNLPGLSNARLYSTGVYVPPPPPPICTHDCGPPPCTLNCGGGGDGNPTPPGVPEPAAWALMILGFGGAGAMLRRRRMAVAAR